MRQREVGLRVRLVRMKDLYDIMEELAVVCDTISCNLSLKSLYCIYSSAGVFFAESSCLLFTSSSFNLTCLDELFRPGLREFAA